MFIGCNVALQVAVNWHEVDGSKLNILDATLQMARDLILIRLCYVTGIWKLEKDAGKDKKDK